MKKILFSLFMMVYLVFSLGEIKERGKEEIYQIQDGYSFKLYAESQQRDTWTKIVAVQRKNALPFLLYYDSKAGELLVKEDCKSRKEESVFPSRNTWKDILALDIDGDGNEELFFYDPSGGDKAGYAELYSVAEGFSKRKLLGKWYDWNNRWKTFTIIDFGLDQKKELLRYDDQESQADIVRFLPCNQEGYNAKILNTFSGWRGTWKSIISVSIEYGAYREGILLYDPYVGEWELLAIQDSQQEPFASISTFKTRKGWKEIVSGNFGAGNILLYDAISGEAEIYALEGKELSLKKKISTKKTWKSIVPYAMAEQDALLFYESANYSDICLPTYDGTNQALHPDVFLDKDGYYKMVFTPYPYCNDLLENPSVLRSKDGFVFEPIPVKQNLTPLMDTPSLEGTPYTYSYNNDPDFFRYEDKYYMVYNETKTSETAMLQKVYLMVYDLEWKQIHSWVLQEQKSFDVAWFSPSFVLLDKEVMLFYVRKSNDACVHGIFFRKSSIQDIQNIAQKEEHAVLLKKEAPFSSWHINALHNPFNQKIYLLIAGKFQGANPGDYFPSLSNFDLFMARSNANDYTTFDLNPTPVLQRFVFPCTNVYRPAFLFTSQDRITLWCSFMRSRETGIALFQEIPIETKK